MATTKTSKSRCWPGYEPVPGKAQNEQGSCRPKPESKLSAPEREFRAKRKRQLDKWEQEHPGSPRQAAQNLKPPAAKKKTAKKERALAKK